MSCAGGGILRTSALARLGAVKLSIGNWAWQDGDMGAPVAANLERLLIEMPSVVAEPD